METLDALIACLPPVAYAREAAAVRQELAAVAQVLDDAQASADVMVAEHQPDLATLSLADWERNYSLPDEAIGGGTTIADRRAALLARISARGDLSRAHLIALAALVGFPGATITEAPLMTCEDACDGAVDDDTWIGAWQMDAPATGTGSQDVLRRVIQRRKPAHTIGFVNFF